MKKCDFSVTHPIIYISLPNMNNQTLTEGHKIILFVGYTAGMYLCYITAAIFEEKLYLKPEIDTKYPTPEITTQKFQIFLQTK